MIKVFLALLMAAPSLLFAQVQGAGPTIVSLEDALRIAEASAPSMRQSRNSLRSARMSLTQRYAAFLPSISTNASFTPAQNGSNANYTTSISAGLNGLFNQNTYFAVGTARRALESQQASAVTARFQLRSTVKQQYFGVLQAREQLTSAQNSLKVAEANMIFVRARVETGTVVATDSLGQLQTVNTALLAINTAQNNIANQIRTFSRTLGLETLVQPDPADTANFQIIQLDSAVLIGMLRDSPQAVQQRTSVASQRTNLRNAKLAYIPTLSGGVSWGRNGSGEGMWGFGEANYRYSGGQPRISFSVSLPVFNAFGREAGLISAREAVENAELNARDQMLTQESNLINLINSIHTTVEQMRLQGIAIMIAERNMEVVELRYDLNIVDGIQLLSAQNGLFNARNSLISSRNTYRNQIAQLEALIGRELR